jgi:hypothetical protein
MDKENVDLLIKELSGNSEKWTKLSIDTLYRSWDLQVHNNEREFNLFLNIVTISIAFLTIGVPLIKGSFSSFLLWAIVSLLLTSICGISVLVITIVRDRRLIKTDSDFEYNTFRGYLEKDVSIQTKLYDYKETHSEDLWNKILLEADEYMNSRKSLNDEVKQRMADKEKELSFKILKYLRIAFWCFFISAFIVLGIWLIYFITTDANSLHRNCCQPRNSAINRFQSNFK